MASPDRVVAAYILQIGHDGEPENTFEFVGREKRILAELPSRLEETEENLTDQLPEGWRAVITKWDEGGNSDG